MSEQNIRVTTRGAARWTSGHPWIYRSDTMDHAAAAGLVAVLDRRGKFLGQALYSPASEISLRLLEPTERPVDAAWWVERIRAAWTRRAGIDATRIPRGARRGRRASPRSSWTGTTAGS